jgi:hypothetical protein
VPIVAQVHRIGAGGRSSVIGDRSRAASDPRRLHDVRLVPYRRLEFRSDEPPGIVGSKLARLVVPKIEFMTHRPEPFRGSFQAGRFKLVRRDAFHDPWRPVVLGDLVQVGTGTQVTVRFRLPLFPGVMTAIWFALGLFGIAQNLRSAGQPATSSLHDVAGMSFGMLVVYGWICFSFGRGVESARRALRDGLGCREGRR